MSKKRLVLVRYTNVLRIFDEDVPFRSGVYTCIFGVTGVKLIEDGWYDVYSNRILIGFISDVIEVKEIW